MPTLGEVARSLRISRHTLDKWLARLEIQPTQHPRDFRYWVISDTDVDAIRAARAEMPGNSHVIPSYSPLDDRRRQSVEGMSRRPAVPRATDATPLPDGLTSIMEVAKAHHFPHTTLRRMCERGEVETDAGSYGGTGGQFAIQKPITARGLQQFYAKAHTRPDFTPCGRCPHDA